jgi:hypothetical protein
MRFFILTDMRKTISKRIRFEVFKRDKFTCQYCGQSAPNVTLNIDHIHPVSKGGGNDIMNLITACFDCNSGKRDRVLSDESALAKQKIQLDELQERTNQIKLMSMWQKELVKQDHEKTQIALDVIGDLFGVGLNELGLKNLRNKIKSFGISEVCESFRIAHAQYYDGTTDSIEECIKKSGGICYNRYYERERAKNG